MQKNNFHLSAAGYLILFLIALLLPLNGYASQKIYTIQSNSYIKMRDAQRHFDSIVNTLDASQLDNLRIEKIKQYYCVRLGNFKGYTSSRRLLAAVKPKLPNAIVMKTFMLKERIVKLYSAPASINIKEHENRVSSTSVHDKVKSSTANKADKKVNGVPLKKDIEKIEALVRKNEYVDALDIITAEIIEQPEHPDLNAWFGMVLLKMDKPLDALQYLEKATELSPDAPYTHNSLGYSFFFLERFDEAIDEFNKAIRLDPGHFDALTGLCIAYAKISNQEKAMDIYHKIKKFNKETANQLLTIIKSNF